MVLPVCRDQCEPLHFWDCRQQLEGRKVGLELIGGSCRAPKQRCNGGGQRIHPLQGICEIFNIPDAAILISVVMPGFGQDNPIGVRRKGHLNQLRLTRSAQNTAVHMQFTQCPNPEGTIGSVRQCDPQCQGQVVRGTRFGNGRWRKANYPLA